MCRQTLPHKSLPKAQTLHVLMQSEGVLPASAWQNTSVDLSDYDGKTIEIWIIGVVGPDVSGDSAAWQSDFAIDNIKVGASGTLGEQSAG